MKIGYKPSRSSVHKASFPKAPLMKIAPATKVKMPSMKMPKVTSVKTRKVKV